LLDVLIEATKNIYQQQDICFIVNTTLFFVKTTNDFYLG